MPTATRTLNPLHFEDLEPHRFEDMVRQLAYSFRNWHVLEATGRLGADEGTDIRGIERLRATRIELGDIEHDDEETPAHEIEEREWRIQCKRERRIGPKPMASIVEAVLGDEQSPPYGVIVAAACDFSKATRDVFRSRLAEAGVEEFILWGKAELEDLLFRPSNDHLLWAYFGISLRVRRASMAATLRHRLAMKRVLHKKLCEIGGYPEVSAVMIRDVAATEYPWPSDPSGFLAAPRWRFYELAGHVAPDVLGFVTRRHLAWWSKEENRFDAIFGVDTSWPHQELFGIELPASKQEQTAGRFWDVRVPKEQQATLVEVSGLHYDQIVAVDEFGDVCHEGPHLIVDFEGRDTPFRRSRSFINAGHGGGSGLGEPLESLERARYFPEELPEISQEEWNQFWDIDAG